MTVSNYCFAICAAGAITAAVTQLAVELARAVRRHDYLHFEKSSLKALVERYVVSQADSGPAEIRRESMSADLDACLSAANAAQTRYYNAVVRSAACLLLAFVALATEKSGLPAGAAGDGALPGLVRTTMTMLDPVALVAMFGLFRYGRSRVAPWIRLRTVAEFLRQYQYMLVLFPKLAADDEDPRLQFAAERHAIEERVVSGPIKSLPDRVDAYWAERKSNVLAIAGDDIDISSDVVKVYVEKRVVRQLSWFIDSRLRLDRIGHRNRSILVALYILTTFIAFLKVFFYPAILVPCLLILTGLSGAMTAYYFNQNVRSLMHRYFTQERGIRKLLDLFGNDGGLADRGSAGVTSEEKNSFRRTVIDFEGMMIDELHDWIAITNHDVMELS
jgi:hypothetical protein